MTEKQLIGFSKTIAYLYECGVIKAPVHLHRGNEKQLIKIFKKLYKKGDWIFSTHRSHYHWLLAGKDKKELVQQILDGHSMSIFGDKFLTSSIVGGVSPIALGVAMALKLNGSKNKVLCFIGDAAFNCGVTKESIRHAEGHNLPIVFIVEDNGYSVRAKTSDTWGTKKKTKVIKYKYKKVYPHAGTGAYVMFL